MKCHECLEQLSAYSDQILTSAQQEEVRQHLDTCPSCQEELAYLEEMLQAIKSLNEIEIPETLHQQIMQRVAEENGKSRSIAALRNWVKYAAGLAAALFVLVVLVKNDSTGLNSPINQLTKMEMPLEAPAEKGTASVGNRQESENSIIANNALFADGDNEINEMEDMPGIARAQIVFETWEVQSQNKADMLGSIEQYINENGLEADYLPNTESPEEIIIYQIPNKDVLFEVIIANDKSAEINKENVDGEILKIILK